MTPDTIRTIRAELGYSQAELARRMGVTVTTVSRWETGLRRPDRRSSKWLERAVRRMV